MKNTIQWKQEDRPSVMYDRPCDNRIMVTDNDELLFIKRGFHRDGFCYILLADGTYIEINDIGIKMLRSDVDIDYRFLEDLDQLTYNQAYAGENFRNVYSWCAADNVTTAKPGYWNVPLKVPGRYYSKFRGEMRIGRYIRKKMKETGIQYSDAAISEFVTSYTAGQSCSIEIVCGEDITKAYRDCFGSTSCMTDDCADYTTIYEANPDKVRMIKVKSGRRGRARALVWNTDQGVLFIDRAYGNDSSSKKLIRLWGELQKEYGPVIRYDEEAKRDNLASLTRMGLTVSGLKPSKHGYLPFSDGFQSANRHANDNGTVESYDFFMTREGNYWLDDTTGGYRRDGDGTPRPRRDLTDRNVIQPFTADYDYESWDVIIPDSPESLLQN